MTDGEKDELGPQCHRRVAQTGRQLARAVRRAVASGED